MPPSGTAEALIERAGQLTVYELFRSRAERDPGAQAIQAGTVSLSYSELDRRVRNLAGGLAAQGVGRGDRIALLSENRLEYVEIELAAAFLGAIAACQNWRLTGAELRHCIELVTPKLLIVSARFAGVASLPGLEALPRVLLEDDYPALLRGPPADPDENIDPEDGLVILYTSGTTGLPKGALISHRAEIARMIAMRLDLHARDDDAFLAWSPLFHMAATDHALAALMSGAAVIVVDGFDVTAIVAAMTAQRLGWLVLMPGSIEPVVAHLRQNPIVPKGIRAVGAMADLVPRALIAELTRLTGAPYLNSFGATETGLPPCSAALLPPGVVPATLSKRQSSLCDIKLLDPEGNVVAPGEAGELAIRGPTVFSGYWNAECINRADFSGGYFRMGDLFRRNPDGSYDFVDRAKYMIKSGGENIYPAEIERVLLADPRIADAVVVRRTDARWGEVPVAFVARTDEELTEADVEAICRAGLAGYKRPKAVRFIAVDAFPRSTTGKIQRHEMEKWA
jgi:fatty-acyl-CoA synthase